MSKVYAFIIFIIKGMKAMEGGGILSNNFIISIEMVSMENMSFLDLEIIPDTIFCLQHSKKIQPFTWQDDFVLNGETGTKSILLNCRH